jgi:hypothetical protein
MFGGEPLSQTNKAKREAYNKAAYKQIIFRVRKKSKLLRQVEDFQAAGNSINALITERLEAYFQHMETIMSDETFEWPTLEDQMSLK